MASVNMLLDNQFYYLSHLFLHAIFFNIFSLFFRLLFLFPAGGPGDKPKNAADPERCLQMLSTC